MTAPLNRPLVLSNARLVDPLSGYDGPGALYLENGRIADVSRGGDPESLSPDVQVIDCGGAMLAPGLVDLRVKTGEPGAEPKEKEVEGTVVDAEYTEVKDKKSA